MNVAQVLLESLPEPHLILARDFSLLGANSSFLNLLHTSLPELIERTVSSFWPSVEQDCRGSGEHTLDFIDSRQGVVTARISCEVSECIVVRVLASAAPGESLQLHHRQRVETLGIIAGGVAHDFNNVLTGILGHVAYLKHVLPKQHQGFESVLAIEEGALKAAGLTQQILSFSRLEASEQLTQVEVSSVMSSVATLLKSAIPADVSLSLLPGSVPFKVLASEVNIAQILINLIINARDAISGRGKVEITLQAGVDQRTVAGFLGDEPASSKYGIIEVRDTGSGMNEHVKARLFEPYFTTKNAAGTGLGLATVNSIVKQLGGAVQVESEVGCGTVFRIMLPLVSDLVSEEQPGTDEQAQFGESTTKGRGERILVIDDEDAVRNVLGLSLAHLGYDVETASSGREGLEKFQAAQGAVRLVILDLLMPGLSGEDVFYRLREMQPDLRVLIVSGFSSAHVVERLLEEGGSDFIQKPFSIEVLSEKVRGCLGD